MLFVAPLKEDYVIEALPIWYLAPAILDHIFVRLLEKQHAEGRISNPNADKDAVDCINS